MSVKLSELTASTGITSDDLFLTTNDPGGTPQSRKATAQQVLDYITGSTFNTLTVTNLTGTNSELTGVFSGTFLGDGSALTGIIIPVDNFTLGSTNIILGTTASVIQGLSIITGSTVTGSTALFDNITSSVALFTGDIRVLGTASITQLNTVGQQSLVVGDKYITILSGGVDHTGINGAGFLWGTSSGPGETTGALGEHAHILYDSSRDALEIFPGLYVTGSTTLFGVSGTIAQFTSVTASIISASQYVGIPSTTPGGLNQSVQFNSGSTFSGSTNLIYNFTTNTLSGTTAQFTTLSASSANVSGSLVIDGPVNLAQFPDYAYVLYTASFDKIVVFPGLYVSGNLTGSGLGAFQTVSGSTGLFTTLTGSTITGSTALFTTITASNISASNNIIAASNLIVNGGQISSSASTLTLIAGTTVDIKDNTIITGNLTVTGIISGSSYLGVSGGGGTPGGTNTTLQFNSGSAFSGSTRLSWDYVANTLFVSGSTNISGTLTATAKSFDIAHPTRDGMRLRYGSLEGPENGVYVRGVATSNIIELPEHWTGLVHEDSITVNLTPFGSRQNIWVDKVENNKVYINGDLVKCYFTVFAERKDISKLVVEY